jgi:hypothetical protein
MFEIDTLKKLSNLIVCSFILQTRQYQKVGRPSEERDLEIFM